MSPEQAEPIGGDVDTRTDVYSLGVLLYEMMTGTTPLDAIQLREAGFAEMQRMIREETPPRPSRGYRRWAILRPSWPATEGPTSVTWRGCCAGDLDWIAMKALEKDRDRRYATPGAFAEDVERYLRREVIQARPPSAMYRLRRFARRNRGAVLAVAAVATTLVAGSAVATWQAVVATRARHNALDAAEAARKAKETAEAQRGRDGRRARLRSVSRLRRGPA